MKNSVLFFKGLFQKLRSLPDSGHNKADTEQNKVGFHLSLKNQAEIALFPCHEKTLLFNFRDKGILGKKEVHISYFLFFSFDIFGLVWVNCKFNYSSRCIS